MGVTIATVRVAANTSTGTQDITTTDLGGLTPKAVLLIATRCVTDGTAVDGAGMYWGASDGTNEWAQSYESQHAQASMNMQMTQDATANRILTIHNGAAASIVDATADFDSFITNGVRINWTDAPASAFLVTAVFFAGTDLSVHVGNQDLGTTPDDLIAITSVGFEADVLITTVLRSVALGGPSFGFVHNDRAGTVTQRSASHKQRDNFSSGFVAAMMRNDACFLQMSSTDILDWFGTAQSFDSSGFDIQLGNSRGAANSDIGWIALRFGASPVVESKVYTYSTPTGTGSNTDSNPNFTPQFVMYTANRAATANTLETDADGGTIGVVTVDADDLYSNSVGDEDAAADSNTQSLSDDKVNLPTHTGGSGHEATLTSLGSTGPVWNFSATDGTARLWPALAIEAFSAGGTEYTQSASGGVTPSGAMFRDTSKVTVGGITPSGAIARSAAKILSGALLPGGTLTRQAEKLMDGSVTPGGLLARLTAKLFNGDLSPSGELSSIRSFLKELAGALTPSGALARLSTKITDGSITPGGLLSRLTARSQAGTLSPSGGTLKEGQKPLTGTLSSDGSVSRSTGKSLAGGIVPAGTLSKLISRLLSGVLSLAGTLENGATVVMQPTARLIRAARDAISVRRKDVRVKRDVIETDPHKGT